MARVFITGSADGLGRAAAQTLLNDGHEVVVHARNRDRLTAVRDLLDRGAAAVVGDLSDLEETRGLARDVNRLGRLDAVIHNAGVYTGPHVLPVNVVAPYLLTALIDRPQRLVYLSSSEHRSGRPSLTGIDWSGRRTTGSYPDSKLFVTTLTVAVARRWAEVFSNAVDLELLLATTDAAELVDVVHVPGAAAKLSVGRRLEADVLLHGHDLGDGVVLDRAQLVGGDAPSGVLFTSGQEPRRT